MKVWHYGEEKNIEIGDEVFVGHCGSGRTVFGESGYLEKVTEKHLVFKTESGATIKTKLDCMNEVVGKFGKLGNFVKLGHRPENEYVHCAL